MRRKTVQIAAYAMASAITISTLSGCGTVDIPTATTAEASNEADSQEAQKETETSDETKKEEKSEDSIPEGNQLQGNWVYEVTESQSGGPGSHGGPGGQGGPGDSGNQGEGPGGSGAPGQMQGDGSSKEAHGDSNGAAPSEKPDMDGQGKPDGMKAPDSERGNAPGGMGGPGGQSASGEATATLLWGNGNETSSNVTMFPAELGGYKVTTLGNGAQNITSNNKNDDVYVLIPEGVTTISSRMIYDYNTTKGWSIPSTVTSIDSQAFLSCAGTFYGESDSAAETFAEGDSTRDFVSYTEDNSQEFTVKAGENGYIDPNGTYHLPSGMLDGKHKITFNIVADYQYKIKSLVVDGQEVADAAGQNEYDLQYTFTTDSSSIEVTFEEDPDDSRDPSEFSGTFDYDAPEIESAAVTEDIDLTDETLYEYASVNTGATAKYTNSMGVSTGEYYAANGKLYKMVYSSQETDEPEYYSKAEVINGVYEAEGLVYGKDYDEIRLYNYCENVDSGPAQGLVTLYCTYLYKEIDVDDVTESKIGNDSINTASVFVQEGGDLTLDNFVSVDNTSSKGPSEAGNFFGLGSAIHVDGGDNTTSTKNTFLFGAASLVLNQPNILGRVNSIYSLANGVLTINGGNIFSCCSGGHGPYASCGGQIYINTEGTNIVGEDGSINVDLDTLEATERPGDIATMQRGDDDKMEGVFEEHASEVTAIVTGDESGTALATDTGGGVIVANRVSTKTYGLRCAGVYSIGSNESWVYCYNSTLKSYLDAGLCSASGGYIFADNCDISGVMGLKTRGGSGSGQTEETGIHVSNSRVQVEYDDEEMQKVYDVASPEDWDDSILDKIKDLGATAIDMLNIFLDKANNPSFIEDSLNWWFKDKSKTPGYSGGNKFAVIYVENSSTPITIEASLLKNKNYEDYGDASKLSFDETPADNLIVSVEGAGAADITFTDENSSTKWDKTGAENETCELTGDFFIGAYSNNEGGTPDIGTGANSLKATFVNSEWEGTVLYGDDEKTGSATLIFDKDSSWKVTEDTVVDTIEAEDVNAITADKKVTITFTNSDSIKEGTYGNVTFVKA
ncbi:hypothetical protein BXO88_11160 [Oribacterium sp. C9]|uniref:hypothetical protein n=1 Tax=Oribacterium sp. C9 TaxID=1943579 RepID=UPI00098F46BE|nr:hypothetical protein [Oribacterium sp. C9]OON85640.1 hypothetical protein BXO88_11160 [Oribacterium sp. C9]